MTNRLGALSACLVAAAVAVPATANAAPVATASKTCSTPKYPGNGYFTSLKVFNTSCATGRKLMLAHYRKRTNNGIRGKARRVGSWRCGERRYSAPTQYNSRVTCRSGSRKVVFTYQQNT